MHTCMHTYIHAYIYYIHAYIYYEHTHTHTHTHTFILYKHVDANIHMEWMYPAHDRASPPEAR